MSVPPTDPEIDLTKLEAVETTGVTGSLRVRCFGVTDIGPKREANEDDFLIAELSQQVRVCQAKIPRPEVFSSEEKAFLFVVSDGMGGHAGGATASLTAVGHVRNLLANLLPKILRAEQPAQQEILDELRSAVAWADQQVFEHSQRDSRLEGMGCTLTVALCAASSLYVAHVGDSRCYRWRAGSLTRLTQDHNIAEGMMRAGQLSPEEAAKHKWRHVLTNALGGMNQGVEVELRVEQLEAGDAVLLCSDGLTGVVPEPEIEKVLANTSEAREACQLLIAMALARQNPDNVTVTGASRFSLDAVAGVPSRGPAQTNAAPAFAHENRV
jgi:serine/threonine protein phosphatase PrpC